MSIITSLLDNDMYKFTMAQAVFEKFPYYNVEYKFTCRNDQFWTEEMVEELNLEIDDYCKLEFSKTELDYLSSLRFFKPDFIHMLNNYSPERSDITAILNGDQLELNIKGKWLQTIFYEVPLLAMINEYYFSKNSTDVIWISGCKRLRHKFKLLHQTPELKFADFGTRRRFSKKWQMYVIGNLSFCDGFIGTSNLDLARQFDLTPIGTMAHEWIMGGAGCSDIDFIDSQSAQLQTWCDVYRGDLGIALTDTYGLSKFLNDFDLYFAKLYDGLRHDSGCPIVWGHRVIAHYKKLGIDPTTKTLVFSDGLTVYDALDIYDEFKDQAKLSFGIGTHFTNDFEGIEPLKIVIKLTRCNNTPTIKISDESSKTMCEDLKFKETVFKLLNINRG